MSKLHPKPEEAQGIKVDTIIPQSFKLNLSVLKHSNSKSETSASGYKPLGVSSPDELINILNTYHTVFATLKNGKRNDASVDALCPVIKLDIDAEGAIDTVLEALEPYEYVKVPSQSGKDYKAHIIVLCDGEADIRKAGYAAQVDAFLIETGISVNVLDASVLYAQSGYLAPASCGKALTVESAGELSYYHAGKRYELIDLEANGIVIKTNSKKKRKLLGDIDTVEPNLSIKEVEAGVNILNPDSTIAYYGEHVPVKDVVEAIKAENDTNAVYGGFGCPICNKEHTMDTDRTPYAFAFISTDNEDVMFKCSGNACSDKPLSIMDPPRLYLNEYDEIYFDIAKGKFVFVKGRATFIHTFTNAKLMTGLDDKHARNYLNAVPRLCAEYNPTQPHRFVNRNGIEAINLFKPSKFVENHTKGEHTLPKEFATLLEHLISDDETRNVFINALANHLQNGTSIHLGWIFKGVSGAGKGLFMEIMALLFGSHNFQKTKLCFFTGDKIKGVTEKLIAFADETAGGEKMKEIVENLKAIIANKDFSSRALHNNEVDVQNFAMYFFAVNSFGFKLDEDDRRMNIINCPKKLDKVVENINEFYNKVTSDEVIQQLADYLMSYEVDDTLITKIVDTEFRQEMITENLPLNQRIAKCIIENSLDPIMSEVDEDNLDIQAVENELSLLHRYNMVQGTVVTNLAKKIFKLTDLNIELYHKNTITKLLKEKWEYKVVKRNLKPYKVFVLTEQSGELLTEEMVDIELFNSEIDDF